MAQYIKILTQFVSSSSTHLFGWSMVGVFVIFNSLGALMLKAQVQKLGSWCFTNTQSFGMFFLNLLSAWQSWVALGLISFATGAWVIALNKLEISKAYPVAVGLNLLIVLSSSLLILNEPLTLSKIFGSLLILLGVILLFK